MFAVGKENQVFLRTLCFLSRSNVTRFLYTHIIYQIIYVQ